MDAHNSTYQERLATAVTFGILSGIAVISCGIVIFLTIYSKLYKTTVNVVLVNGILADLLLNSCNLIFEPANILSYDQLQFDCHWIGFVTYVTASVSAYTIPSVALNRYIALCHSYSFKRIYTNRNVVLMTCYSWMASILVILPFHISGRTTVEWQYQICGIFNEDSTAWTIYLCFLASLALIGNIVTAYCNSKIFQKLRNHAKSTNGTLSHNAVTENKEILYLTVLHTLFGVCLLSPYTIGKMAPALVNNTITRRLFPCLFILNGVANPISTLCLLKPYRKAIKNLLTRGKDQSQLNFVGTMGQAQGSSIQVNSINRRTPKEAWMNKPDDAGFGET